MNETLTERRNRAARETKVTGAVAATITSDEMFAAQYKGKTETVTEMLPVPGGELQGRDGENAFPVTHKRSPRVVMYKPDGRGHFAPRIVDANAIPQLLENGFRSSCPECGGHHGANPNDCPGRDPVAVRQCPVCPKRIYDNMDLNPTQVENKDDDPNLIIDDAYASSTPATRTRVLLDMHIWAKHPQSARIMNLTPLAEPSTEMLDAMAGSAGLKV